MVLINPHYNGPTGCGHGGVSAGRFAEVINPTSASVRLARPIPLGTELDATHTGNGPVEIRAGERLIATVTPLAEPLGVGDLVPVADDVLAAAEARSPFAFGKDHPYPLCFGCGNARPDHDGLELFAGRLDHGDRFGVRWTPAGLGEVPPWLVWGALDCPTAAPAMDAVESGSKVLTGTLTVDIRDSVVAGQQHQILSRLVDVDGRKVHTEGALLAADGATLAVVAATWIIVDADLEVGA